MTIEHDAGIYNVTRRKSNRYIVWYVRHFTLLNFVTLMNLFKFMRVIEIELACKVGRRLIEKDFDFCTRTLVSFPEVV